MIYPMKVRATIFFDIPEEAEIISASLVVNSDTLRSVRSTRATHTGDTLKILNYQTDPAYHHEFLVTIYKGKYKIRYNFLTSGEEVNREVSTVESSLILNSLDFKKGKKIRGHTEFKGRCIKGCWEDSILITGNFQFNVE